MSNLAPHGWEECTLDKCLDLLTDFEANGSFASVKENVTVFDNKNYAWYVRATDLEKKSQLSDVKFVDEHSFNFLKKTRLSGNEVLITKRGEIGKIYYFKPISKPSTLAPNLYLLKLNESVDPKFIYYSFASDEGKRKLIRINASTTMGALYKNDVKSLTLTLPSLPEQQKIAKILTSVDDVIETTQAQIDKLKDLKTGMMQELLTNGIGHTEFKDSPVGRVPAEWEVKPLIEVVRNIIDCEHKTAPYVEKSEYLVVRTSNVRNGELTYQDIKFTSKEGFKAWTKRAVPSVGDVLFTREAPAGESCLVPVGFNLCMGQRMVLLRPNTEIMNHNYFSTYLNSEFASQEIYELSIGTTVTRINIDDIKKIKCIVPPLAEQAKIAAFIGSVKKAILSKQNKLSSLADMKKALMQDLLTGKVRVKVDSE